jgi:hypothetical protein
MERNGGVEEKRRQMKPVSEAMRGLAESLGREVESWPGVTVKSAFGMSMIYRGGVVFAALPKTRALYDEEAIMVKFLDETPALARRIAAEKRFAPATMEQQQTSKSKRGGEGRKWRFFVMRGGEDVHAAMEWLGEAYHVAKGVPPVAR